MSIGCPQWKAIPTGSLSNSDPFRMPYNLNWNLRRIMLYGNFIISLCFLGTVMLAKKKIGK